MRADVDGEGADASEGRVVRVRSLFEEEAGGGRRVAYAGVERFYRASNTHFAHLFVDTGDRELFLSGHVDERVPLTAVLGSADVCIAGPDTQTTEGLVCRFFYDYRAMTLGAVPSTASS